MIRINLLPVRAAQKKEMLRGQLVVLTLCVVVALVGCAGFYASLFFKAEAVKKEIAQKEAQINRLKKTIGEVAHFKKLQEELR
jgi:type IV pilus assembly protein PilN